jgi:hypothetical protein
MNSHVCLGVNCIGHVVIHYEYNLFKFVLGKIDTSLWYILIQIN